MAAEHDLELCEDGFEDDEVAEHELAAAEHDLRSRRMDSLKMIRGRGRRGRTPGGSVTCEEDTHEEDDSGDLISRASELDRAGPSSPRASFESSARLIFAAGRA